MDSVKEFSPRGISLSAAFAAMLMVAAACPVIAQENTGSLKAKGNPSRAGVFIDGKYVGPAENFGFGRKYNVAVGDHEVRLSEPRYQDFVEKVTIRPGKTTKLEYAMKPLEPAKPPFGLLRTISEDKFAAVYVNDKYMGHAGEYDNRVQALKLNPGEYRVRIVPTGSAKEIAETARIETDKVTIVPAEAAKSAANETSRAACAGSAFSDQPGIAPSTDCL